MSQVADRIPPDIEVYQRVGPSVYLQNVLGIFSVSPLIFVGVESPRFGVDYRPQSP